jgi:hypothetical protein
MYPGGLVDADEQMPRVISHKRIHMLTAGRSAITKSRRTPSTLTEYSSVNPGRMKRTSLFASKRPNPERSIPSSPPDPRMLTTLLPIVTLVHGEWEILGVERASLAPLPLPRDRRKFAVHASLLPLSESFENAPGFVPVHLRDLGKSSIAAACTHKFIQLTPPKAVRDVAIL